MELHRAQNPVRAVTKSWENREKRVRSVEAELEKQKNVTSRAPEVTDLPSSGPILRDALLPTTRKGLAAISISVSWNSRVRLVMDAAISPRASSPVCELLSLILLVTPFGKSRDTTVQNVLLRIGL